MFAFNRRLLLLCSYGFIMEWGTVGHAQETYLNPIQPMDERYEKPDFWCQNELKGLVGKQLVEDMDTVVKHQSVPAYMKVTKDELALKKSKLRIVHDGDIITMEHNPDRLTIQLNEYDFIVKAYCG